MRKARTADAAITQKHPGRPTPPEGPRPFRESLTQLAIRIYDTSDPPVSANRAAHLAGIRRQTLYRALAVREKTFHRRCPYCHRLPLHGGDAEPSA